VLNEYCISIPYGSEDNKANSLEKNHYEENIYKFEDQRFEIDIAIEKCKAAKEEMNKMLEKISSNETIDESYQIPMTYRRLIQKMFKDISSQILENIYKKPKKIIPWVISMFNKKIENLQSNKQDLEKNIKLAFDRSYIKSFDYRSFRFKTFEKKNTNIKGNNLIKL